MRQRPGRKPYLRWLRVALMQIRERAVIGTYLDAGIETAGNDWRMTEGRNVDAVNVIATPLFNYRIDAP